MNRATGKTFALAIVGAVAVLGGLYLGLGRSAEPPPVAVGKPPPVPAPPAPALHAESVRDSIAPPSAPVSPAPPATAATAAPPMPGAFSRAEAKEVLARRVADVTARAVALPVEAQVEFDLDKWATPEQKARFAEARRRVEESGGLYLVAQIGGRGSHQYEARPLPRTVFPEVVRANLTEADWAEFQYAYALAHFFLQADQRATKAAAAAK